MATFKLEPNRKLTVADLRAFLAELPPKFDVCEVWADGCDCIEAAVSVALHAPDGAVDPRLATLYVLRQPWED